MHVLFHQHALDKIVLVSSGEKETTEHISTDTSIIKGILFLLLFVITLHDFVIDVLFYFDDFFYLKILKQI